LNKYKILGLHHGTSFKPNTVALNIVKRFKLKTTIELFELRDHTNPKFNKYLESLERVLSKGVKMACFASFFDNSVGK
jgi:hypothetical protein